MPDLSVSGTTVGQPISDMASVSPFAGVSITTTASAAPYATASVAMASSADGALSHLGVGTLSADGATYTVSGSPALVQAALRGLVFTPVAHEVPVGQSVVTGFTVTASDAAGAVTDTRTTVVATAADTLPTITDTSATQVPRSYGDDFANGAANASNFSFAPFAFTTISDPDAGATETIALGLSQNGAPSDAAGVLSGTGLTKTGVGAYTLAAASPVGESAALQALRFTAAQPGTATHFVAGLTVSDGVGAPVTANLNIGLAGNPGGSTVIANGAEYLTTFNDTPIAQPTHTYATIVDAVLSNGSLVYERSFDLPYSDPQVQAAVAQAKAAVQAAGQTPGMGGTTASNLTVLSSQTATMETGREQRGVGTVTSVNTFGPDFIGPNTSVASGVADEVDRGFFFILPGQLAIEINTVITTIVSRTVTTTSTDLLSQQYVITGSPAAMPTTTLVSSSAAGVEGNSSSFTSSIVGGVTANGASVLFASNATNLSPGDTNSISDLFLKNTATGAITLISTNAAGVRPNAGVFFGSVDGDGNLVAFTTLATNLDARATDGNSHLYVRNVSAGTLTLVSPVDYTIRNARTGAGEAATNFTNLTAPSISGDARYVAVQDNPGGASAEILVFDTVNHTAVDLSGLGFVGAHAAFSQDGSTVVFHTNAPLQPAGTLPADADTVRDVYAYTLATGALQLVSADEGANAPSVKGNGDSLYPTVSNDGSRVAFASMATNLDDRDTDTRSDVYVKDLNTGRLFLVDVTADGSTKANGFAGNAYISGDGAMVSFASVATNLVPGVTDGRVHVYVKTLATGAISIVDQSAGGAVGAQGADNPVFSPDSAHLAFNSFSPNLVANDTNGQQDVFYTTLTAAPVQPGGPLVTGGSSQVSYTTGAVPVKLEPAVAVSDASGGITRVYVTVNHNDSGLMSGDSGDAIRYDQPASLRAANPAFTTTGPDQGVVYEFDSTSAAGASTADVQAFLQSLRFSSTNATGTRDVRIYLSDATTSHAPVGVTGGTPDVLTHLTITPPANPGPPVITGVPATATYAVGQATAVAPNAAFSDPSGALSSVAVVIDNVSGNDTFNYVTPAGLGVVFMRIPSPSGGGAAFQIEAQSADATAPLAAFQAFVDSITFTAPAADGPHAVQVSALNGSQRATATEVLTTGGTPVANTAPTLGGAVANQADAAGTPIALFSTVTVTDPDAGQTETVTVGFDATHGAFSAAGCTGSGGSFTGSFVSAAAAQAALRGASFTPTAGQSATTAFTVMVSDGQTTATDSATSVVATYTPPPPPPVGGGGPTTTTTPPSVQYGLLTEFQNLERALAFGVDAVTPQGPIYAAVQGYRAVAAKLDNGQLNLAQAETALAHLVDGTTAAAVASYGFFTGSTPSAAGLNFLVHSPANPTDLNDAYYARFSTENRYINFAVNLATGPGAGAAAFQAAYGSLSLADATAKAYLAVFGTPADAAKVSALLYTSVADGLGGQETRAQYFAQYGGDGPNGQGTKAALVGFLLSNAVHDGSGIYGAATEHYLAALAHGSAPASGSELALTYGAGVNLVGFTPAPDPTVAG